jgi:hypothetical protein
MSRLIYFSGFDNLLKEMPKNAGDRQEKLIQKRTGFWRYQNGTTRKTTPPSPCCTRNLPVIEKYW